MLPVLGTHDRGVEPDPAAGEFQINSYTPGAQALARPAVEPDGDFVVVWSSNLQDGSAEGAFGQRFAASGAPRGSEFRINTYTTGYQSAPTAAVGKRGDFVVVWQSIQDGSDLSIQGRLYDSSGDPVGGEFQVNTFTTGRQYRARVARASDGRFVVSWTSRFADGDSYGIAARRYDTVGNPLGSEFLVNAYTTGPQVFGDLAMEANGNFVTVWEDGSPDRDGSRSAILGKRWDAAGSRLGPDFRVNSYTTGRQAMPSVSVSPAGGFVVVWTSEFGDGSGYGMFARRFAVSGNPIGNDFVVNTYSTGNQYGVLGQVTHDARGNFVIAWHSQGDGSHYGAFAQRFLASGARRGSEFQVNTYTTDPQVRPSVTSDQVGNLVIAWDSQGQDGSGLGVFAQRYGGLRPSALTVDGTGNQMLEPGEAVVVRPYWQNISGGPQTFDGMLLNISGPPGATYTITDPNGIYGLVPNGGSLPCTDCYAVSVSNPTSRPAVHWDAAAVESILPDTQGQQKQWVLHVGRSFSDVPVSSPFYRLVETMLHRGVTGGCTADLFVPQQPSLAPRWPCSFSSRRKAAGMSRLPARHQCSPTFRLVARFADGLRSSPDGASSEGAEGKITAHLTPYTGTDGSVCLAYSRAHADPATVRTAHLQRRTGSSPFCRSVRGFNAARRGHWVRRREFLPHHRSYSRAAGGVYRGDLRPSAVRPLSAYSRRVSGPAASRPPSRFQPGDARRKRLARHCALIRQTGLP